MRREEINNGKNERQSVLLDNLFLIKLCLLLKKKMLLHHLYLKVSNEMSSLLFAYWNACFAC